MPKLLIVIGSTRPGRAGAPIAEWFIDRARGHGGFDIAVADLAEIDLPFLDEPEHPRLRRYSRPHTHDWSATVEAADAFVFVTSEYNHGYPAPLKNAIDFLHHEWRDKAVGFVSYGGVAAGIRSMEQLKQVVTTLKMVVAVEAVNIPFYVQFMDANRRFVPNDVLEQAAIAMLDEVLRLDAVLRTLRTPAPAA